MEIHEAVQVGEAVECGGACSEQGLHLAKEGVLLSSSQSHMASRKGGPSIARSFYFSREVGRPAFLCEIS